MDSLIPLISSWSLWLWRLGLVFLTELTEEVCGTLGGHGGQASLKHRVLNGLWRSLGLTLLRSVQLAAKHSLDFEDRLVLVDTEELEKIIVVVLDQALENLEFHHIVVILGVFGHDVTDLSLGQALKLVVKVVDLLGELCVAAFLMDTYHPLRFVIESDKLVAETPSNTALWLIPLRIERHAGLLRDSWGGKLLLWVRVESLWLERQDGAGSFLIHRADFSVEVVAPLNLLVWALSWESEDLFSGLEVGDDGSLVFARADDETRVGEAPGEGQDTAVVNIREGGNWVVRVTKIPNVDGWVLVIVVGDDELGGDLRVPHHLGLSHGLILSLVLLPKVVVNTRRAA